VVVGHDQTLGTQHHTASESAPGLAAAIRAEEAPEHRVVEQRMVGG